jgi:hypothetical protein
LKENPMKGFIKLGKATEKHEARLKILGYETERFLNGFIVEVSRFEAVDLSTPEGKAKLKKLIEDKGAIPYDAECIAADGTTVKGCFGKSTTSELDKLSKGLSCIVMHDVANKEKKSKKVTKKSLLDF